MSYELCKNFSGQSVKINRIGKTKLWMWISKSWRDHKIPTKTHGSTNDGRFGMLFFPSFRYTFGVCFFLFVFGVFYLHLLIGRHSIVWLWPRSKIRMWSIICHNLLTTCLRLTRLEWLTIDWQTLSLAHTLDMFDKEQYRWLLVINSKQEIECLLIHLLPFCFSFCSVKSPNNSWEKKIWT